MLRAMGGNVGCVLIVGCEAYRTAEGIGLSTPVAWAVDEAIGLITDVVRSEGNPDTVAG